MLLDPLFLIFFFIFSFWLGVHLSGRKEIYKKTRLNGFNPFISIIVPAHNEERNIENTIKAIMKDGYAKKEIIVINDGSNDKTAEMLKKFRNVKVIDHKKRLGKANSLTDAIRQARGEIIVNIDGDTTIEKGVIKKLVAPFEDRSVGAVSGTCLPLKPKTLLQRVQALDYFFFALSKKRQEVLDSVLVIAGPLGAFRKKALEDVGYFDSDTLTEDFDTALKIHKAGYKIRVAADAVGYKVMPPHLLDLWKQRTRWYRGEIEVWRKHKDMALNKSKFGFVFNLCIMGRLVQMIGFLMGSILFFYNLPTVIQGFRMALISIPNLFASLSLPPVLTTILLLFGAAEYLFSLRLLNKRLAYVLYYPLTIPYTLFISLVFTNSFLKEIFGMKKRW